MFACSLHRGLRAGRVRVSVRMCLVGLLVWQNSGFFPRGERRVALLFLHFIHFAIFLLCLEIKLV